MTFVIKLKTKDRTIVETSLTAKNYVSDLVKILSEMASLKPECINALIGFPPKPLNLQCQDASLADIGINSGDTLIIEEKLHATSAFTSEQPAIFVRPNHTLLPKAAVCVASTGLEGPIHKQIIPGDNSCLFTSVGFVMYGYIDVQCGTLMRQKIADAVSSMPEKYSAAMLGKPNMEYCNWILKPESWGGGIELAVLADFFKCEISVVNVVSSNISTFGEENDYNERAYLMFDGVHYDALYLQPCEVNSPMKTLFCPKDVTVLEKVKAFTVMTRMHRQYTDLKSFTLQCVECGTGLTGEAQAIMHAQTTGHFQFGEVNQSK